MDTLTTTICQDILDWLATASQEDILTYVHNLPEDKTNSLLGLKLDLASEVRYHRFSGLSYFMRHNLPTAINEAKQLQFMTDLAQYNPQSVIANYGKQYPNLDLQLLRPDYNGKLLHEWAKTQLELWDKLFLLIVAPAFADYGLYLKTLINGNYPPETLLELDKSCQQLTRDVSVAVAANNYEITTLESGLQTRVKQFLEKLTFLPRDYREEILEGGVGQDFIALLLKLEMVLRVIALALQAGLTLEKENEILELLWDEMSTQAMLRESIRYEKIHQNDRLTIPPDFKEGKLIETLLDLFTVARLSDGSCQQTLQRYSSQLTPQQKAQFLDILESVLIDSPEMQAIFEPADIESFIETMKRENLMGSKEIIINNMRGRLLPDSWPVAKQAMLVVAALF